jgi:ribosomal protein L37AE/L43A
MNLKAAVEAKDVERVRTLLESGADPNGMGEFDRPLLIRAIYLGQTEIARLLISRASDVNVRITSSDDSTPLHWAAERANIEIARLLLAKGAQVDAKTKAGNTPLMWAAKSKDERAVAVAELLIAHGADLNCQGFDGIPLQYAQDEGTPAMVAMLRGRRRASLPGNRRVAKPQCPRCQNLDVEQTDILAEREVWECNSCNNTWSIWYPPYQHRNKTHHPSVATSKLASWSLGLGLASAACYLLSAVPAVICGHSALAEIKRSNGTLGGRRLAITGMVFGYVLTAVFIGALVVSLFESGAQQLRMESQLKAIKTPRIGQAVEFDLLVYPSQWSPPITIPPDYCLETSIAGRDGLRVLRSLNEGSNADGRLISSPGAAWDVWSTSFSKIYNPLAKRMPYMEGPWADSVRYQSDEKFPVTVHIRLAPMIHANR